MAIGRGDEKLLFQIRGFQSMEEGRKLKEIIPF